MKRRTYGQRSICARCDLEIEFRGNRTWNDRGGSPSTFQTTEKGLIMTDQPEVLPVIFRAEVQ